MSSTVMSIGGRLSRRRPRSLSATTGASLEGGSGKTASSTEASLETIGATPSSHCEDSHNPTEGRRPKPASKRAPSKRGSPGAQERPGASISEGDTFAGSSHHGRYHFGPIAAVPPLQLLPKKEAPMVTGARLIGGDASQRRRPTISAKVVKKKAPAEADALLPPRVFASRLGAPTSTCTAIG
jgi:hypothetical protein